MQLLVLDHWFDANTRLHFTRRDTIQLCILGVGNVWGGFLIPSTWQDAESSCHPHIQRILGYIRETSIDGEEVGTHFSR